MSRVRACACVCVSSAFKLRSPRRRTIARPSRDYANYFRSKPPRLSRVRISDLLAWCCQTTDASVALCDTWNLDCHLLLLNEYIVVSWNRICASVYGWRHLVKVTNVTTGVVENNSRLPLGGWLKVTCGLTACTPGLAPGPTLGNEYGRTLPFYLYLLIRLTRPAESGKGSVWYPSVRLSHLAYIQTDSPGGST